MFLLTAAFVAAVVVCVVLLLPPRSQALAQAPDGTIAGAIHIHTNRSDGSGTPDQIAAAGARAGLRFIVFTDHGDATRTPDPPAYRSGVLCLDGVEVSTTGGHYVVVDMPAAPYPLGGEARDVVEDVKRLGGFGIVAHPDSPKADLRWREWTAPFDGIELLNLDTGWRLLRAQAQWPARRRLLAALVGYPFRAPEVIASLIQPTGALYSWEALTRRRRVVVTAGADAHANLPLRNIEPGTGTQFSLPLPAYDASFRVMSTHLRPEKALTGNAPADAAIVMRAIRGGHLYTAVDAVASPASFEFTATNAHGMVGEGDQLSVGGPVTLHVRSNAPSSFTTIVREGSRTISAARDAADLTVHGPDTPGVYWVEVVSPGEHPITWIRSNPIYVRAVETAEQMPVRAASPTAASTPMFDGKTTTGWHTEQDATSLVALDAGARVGGTELRLRFGLSGGTPAGQYASLVYETPGGVGAHDRLAFTLRAEHPMRVSVQLRAGDKGRWRRSVYVDTFDQERTLSFDDFTPVGDTEDLKPLASAVTSVLFVVDTTNTRPGTSGRLWLRAASLQ